jgi:hypothetical protein
VFRQCPSSIFGFRSKWKILIGLARIVFLLSKEKFQLIKDGQRSYNSLQPEAG